MTLRPLRAAILAIAATAFAGAALGQTTPVQPQPRDPNMPAPQNTVPDKIEPGPGSADSTGTLSDKLERSDGVLTPPGGAAGRVIDPPPTNGGMPVIPPAGTPGSSSPNVEPK